MNTIPSIMKYLPPCLLCFASCLHAEEPRMERRALSDGAAAKLWAADEATMSASSEMVKTVGPSLHWHVTVDHFAGEAKYPVGWPRVGLTLKGAACDWTGWDYFHFWIHARTSRSALPRVPAVLNILQGADKSSPYSVILSDLKKDEWLEVNIPVAKLPLTGDVQKLQFNIAEDQYHHQDQLDFFIDDFALLRYAAPTLMEFASVNAVMFSDARHVPASFTLSGIKPEEHKRVTLQLKRDGQVLASGEFEAKRGAQQLALNVVKASLKPGEYELAGTVEGGAAVVSHVRVVESPWR